MKRRHVVMYTESERGWGQNHWYAHFETKEQAQAAVQECNVANTSASAPDYYIQAEYQGTAPTSITKQGLVYVLAGYEGSAEKQST